MTVPLVTLHFLDADGEEVGTEGFINDRHAAVYTVVRHVAGDTDFTRLAPGAVSIRSERHRDIREVLSMLSTPDQTARFLIMGYDREQVGLTLAKEYPHLSAQEVGDLLDHAEVYRKQCEEDLDNAQLLIDRAAVRAEQLGITR